MSDFVIDQLREEDICDSSGFFQTLESLCKQKTDDFNKMLYRFHKREEDGIATFVLRVDGKIVSTMSVVVECKFIHNEFVYSIVAHGEDVATHADYQGRGYGSALLKYCIEYARSCGCYKLILDCSFENVIFYVRHGMRPVEVCMRIDLQ